MIGDYVEDILPEATTISKDEKRVVITYADGSNQIIGTCEIQPTDIIVVNKIPFGLSKVDNRSVYYKEIVVPDSSIMGRLGDFHPSQK